ncbi:hypothetical protein BHM03_00037869 [Ensete ventricosum]|uniref:Uncharacterized protein n=1 Tax=Ensete ventricosum TaxID=4639 RepID=A0A445MJT0_ENSVE|nr:hypothetical protein BHM03_00037869 [Ensete ventricosum]
MVCTILTSAWTWLVRPRKASAVTMNDAGFDAGEGNPGSVIILQKRLGVGAATAASSVGRGWSGSGWCSAPEFPNGRSCDMGPPSSAKDVSVKSGACLVDVFRLRARAYIVGVVDHPYLATRLPFVAYPVVVRFHHACHPCGRPYNRWGFDLTWSAARPLAPPYLRPTSFPRWFDHVGGPVVRRSDDVTTMSLCVIS